MTTTYYPVSTPAEIRQYIDAALAQQEHTTVLPLAAPDDAQVILDTIWNVLDSPALPNSASGPSFSNYRIQLRRLSLKMATQYDRFPTLLVLRGVECTDAQQQGAGGFADVFCGAYRGVKVGLKRLRMYLMMSNTQKAELKRAFYRESMLWKNLDHNHILPFLGVSEDVFSGSVCMVIPWAENGNLRHYIEAQIKAGKLAGAEFEVAIVRWLRQTAGGLAYLHGEGVVHGDLHAGNILVGDNGNIRLTDFGMSLISEGTAYNYGSQHGGGATRWSAPELFDPEEFGLVSSRPTFVSDIYAFACISIELYTGKPPFVDLTDRQVPLRVVRGDRPPRPSLPNGGTMSEGVWSMMQSCWDQQLALRPSAETVARTLAGVVVGPQEIERYAELLRSAMEEKIQEARESGQNRKVEWMTRALLRTMDFYTTGRRDPLMWVLTLGDELVIPPDALIIRQGDSVGHSTPGTAYDFAGRVYNSGFVTTTRIQLSTSPSVVSNDHEVNGFRFIKFWFRSLKPQEILVASPEHVRWIRVSGTFTLDTLGARPIDVSDPPGHSKLELIRPRRYFDSPWIIRHADPKKTSEIQPRCVERLGSVNSNVYEVGYPFGREVIKEFEILCHVD